MLSVNVSVDTVNATLATVLLEATSPGRMFLYPLRKKSLYCWF